MNLPNAKQKEGLFFVPRSCETPYLIGLRLVQVYVVQMWICNGRSLKGYLVQYSLWLKTSVSDRSLEAEIILGIAVYLLSWLCSLPETPSPGHCQNSG